MSKNIEVKYFNPFINAARTVINKLTKYQLKLSEIKYKQLPMPSFEIAIIIGLTGNIKGIVTYSLEKEFGRAIMKKWFPNKLPAELDKLLKSGMSELANMISGNAITKLAGEKKRIDISPPSIIIGNDFSIEVMKLDTVSVVLYNEFGSLEINLALTEKFDF